MIHKQQSKIFTIRIQLLATDAYVTDKVHKAILLKPTVKTVFFYAAVIKKEGNGAMTR